MRTAPKPMFRREPVWTGILVFLVALGALAALRIFVDRWQNEAGDKTVELIVDARSAIQLARSAGVAEEELFATLRDAGVVTLAVAERTLADLAGEGALALLRPQVLSAAGLFDPAGVPSEVLARWDELRAGTDQEEPVLLCWRTGALPVSDEELAERLSVLGGRRLAARAEDQWWVLPGHVEPGTVGVGYDPWLLREAAEQGFNLALRPLDSPAWLSRDATDRLRIDSDLAGRRSLVIFDGRRLPGGPGNVDAWAVALARENLPVAWIEFTPQTGLERLIREHQYQAVRLHSISEAELERLGLREAVARWRRAVLERSVRALYVRLFTEMPSGVAADGLLDLNLDYLRMISRTLTEEGYTVGPASPLDLQPVGRGVQLLLFLSAAAGGILLLRRFVRLSGYAEFLLLTATAGGLALFPLGRQGAAFGAAVIFPTLGTLGMMRYVRAKKGRSLPIALSGFLIASCISLLGALHIVGLLSERPFVIGVDLFLGVKAMHLVPPALVALGIVWGEPLRSLRELLARVVGILRRPVPLGFVVAVMALGGLAALILLRTGNDFLPVSTAERWLRTALEESLPVRPRNKEFLLGHPALLLLAVVVRRHKLDEVWLAAGAALGSIGQLSMVNTFAHVHAPLATSLIRTVLGLLLGVAVGLIMIVLVEGLLELGRRVNAP